VRRDAYDTLGAIARLTYDEEETIQTTAEQDEVKVYMNLPSIKHKEAERPQGAAAMREVLLWWCNRESDLPVLSRLAKKYLSFPASSVAVERIFSTAGNIVTRRRAKMKPENIERWCFLAENADLFLPKPSATLVS